MNRLRLPLLGVLMLMLVLMLLRPSLGTASSSLLLLLLRLLLSCSLLQVLYKLGNGHSGLLRIDGELTLNRLDLLR